MSGDAPPGGCRASCRNRAGRRRDNWGAAARMTGSPQYSLRAWPARYRPRPRPSANARSRCCTTGGCANVTTAGATGATGRAARGPSRSPRPALSGRGKLAAGRCAGRPVPQRPAAALAGAAGAGHRACRHQVGTGSPDQPSSAPRPHRAGLRLAGRMGVQGQLVGRTTTGLAPPGSREPGLRLRSAVTARAGEDSRFPRRGPPRSARCPRSARAGRGSRSG